MARPDQRLLDSVLPPRLGQSFRWLIAFTWADNLGDGIALAAGPLLVASLTTSRVLVASAALVQWLPRLLFGLIAGAVTDRVDRRRLVVAVDGARLGVVGVLGLALAIGHLSVGLVLAALLAGATAETFADNASAALLPMVVDRDDLAVGNARLQVGLVALNQLAGPPLGAGLFVLGRAVPFAGQAVLVLLAIVLVRRMSVPRLPRERTGMRQDVVDGFRWAWSNPAVRTLVLTNFTFNITFGAAWSVLVLYATERLGLGAVGFGLVTTVQAAGGLVGTLGYGWLTRRVSLGDIMRIGLIIETLTHLGLAATTSPLIAMPIFFVFGLHAFVWGTTSASVRQRATPDQLQGRVASVNTVGSFGGLVVGAAIGGVLAERLGVTAPFWFAGAGSALFVVLVWRQLSHIAHAEPLAVE